MHTQQYTAQFDTEFSGISHYQKHPQMMPFVGSEYASSSPRLLIIAESHYLRKSSTIHLDASGWYQSSANQLLDHELSATNTRKCLTKAGKTWRLKSYTIYRNLEAALIEAGYPEKDNTLRHIAFMNAFQRPAVSRLSINSTAIDEEYSAPTIRSVVRIIEPEKVIFVSRKAHKVFASHLDVPTYAVPHPASAWWNRPSKRGTGKAQFLRLLMGH